MDLATPCRGISEKAMPEGLVPGSAAHRAFCALVDAGRAARARGAMLKLEGDETNSVYFVISGWVLVSKSTAEGQRQIIDIVTRGGLVDPASADPRISSVEIEPLTDLGYAKLSRATLVRLQSEHPEIANLVDRDRRAAMARIGERMLRLGKGSAERRVAFALCELCLRTSRGGLRPERSFHIPMSQQQLGDYTGLSSVHICRTLRRFERNAICTVTDHMDIVIHDLDTMFDIAEIDPEVLPRMIATS